MTNDEPTGLGVVHCDPFTGIVFEPSPPFDKYNSRPNPNTIPFDSRDHAIRYCRSVVAEYPHLQCTLVGDPTGEGFVLDDPDWIERESQRRMSLQRSQATRDRSSSLVMVAAAFLTLLVGAIFVYTLC
ncbi:MAG: hypothetical protein ACF8AM_00160 [Rhodopirellula sp. JB055]|uniref:hypothetical protein n=1 Tax=Rhodopirellula sp. JB055 TaxID=3342846 RepID=UPI00370CF830